jgi:hypothetical protein
MEYAKIDPAAPRGTSRALRPLESGGWMRGRPESQRRNSREPHEISEPLRPVGWGRRRSARTRGPAHPWFGTREPGTPGKAGHLKSANRTTRLADLAPIEVTSTLQTWSGAHSVVSLPVAFGWSSRMRAVSRPTVETRSPRVQNCYPTTLCRRPREARAMWWLCWPPPSSTTEGSG